MFGLRVCCAACSDNSVKLHLTPKLFTSARRVPRLCLKTSLQSYFAVAVVRKGLCSSFGSTSGWPAEGSRNKRMTWRSSEFIRSAARTLSSYFFTQWLRNSAPDCDFTIIVFSVFTCIYFSACNVAPAVKQLIWSISDNDMKAIPFPSLWFASRVHPVSTSLYLYHAVAACRTILHLTLDVTFMLLVSVLYCRKQGVATIHIDSWIVSASLHCCKDLEGIEKKNDSKHVCSWHPRDTASLTLITTLVWLLFFWQMTQTDSSVVFVSLVFLSNVSHTDSFPTPFFIREKSDKSWLELLLFFLFFLKLSLLMCYSYVFPLL